MNERPVARIGMAKRAGTPHTLRNSSEELNDMLMYEDLARARMREAERSAAHARTTQQLRLARRWRRLERWAARRARRYDG